MADRKRFQVVLEKYENSTATSIIIPPDVQKEFGARARVPVRGTINGFPFRSSIFPLGGGRHYMLVNRPTREGAKAKEGDIIEVVMERDDDPREIAPPEDLARALKANKTAQAAWKKLSYTNRKEYVVSVEGAKKPETRARRIEKAIAELSADERVKG
jgi:hypothetical protein